MSHRNALVRHQSSIWPNQILAHLAISIDGKTGKALFVKQIPVELERNENSKQTIDQCRRYKVLLLKAIDWYELQLHTRMKVKSLTGSVLSVCLKCVYRAVWFGTNNSTPIRGSGKKHIDNGSKSTCERIWRRVQKKICWKIMPIVAQLTPNDTCMW